MRIHTAELKKAVYDWYHANKEKLDIPGVRNTDLTEVFMSHHPECGHSFASVLKAVQQTRAGTIQFRSDVLNQVRENLKMAEVFQPIKVREPEVDMDPLGVLPDETPDIKKAFFDIPETYSTYKAPLKLDQYGMRMGVVGDIHFPIHDRPATLAGHSLLKKKNIDFLLLNGDILDCSNITRHAHRKSLSYTWRDELEVGRAYIKSLRILFGDIPIIYAEGNHENWFQQYIIRNARELEGDYILRERLGLTENNIEWVEEDRLMTFGKLFVHHGHKLGIGGGANLPSRLLAKHGVNIMVNHWHRVMSDDKRTLDGELHGGWVNGCLSDLHPDYNPHNNSTHGVTIVDLLGEGNFNVNQYKIDKGKIIGEDL